MTGEWIGKKVPPHRCQLPMIGLEAVGERWQCECGQIYVVVSVSQHGETWRQFEREGST